VKVFFLLEFEQEVENWICGPVQPELSDSLVGFIRPALEA
jgi:hypothetical protein